MAESQEQNTTKKDKGVKEFIRNRNHLVFLAFVVLSFIIWFLNYLNKNLSSEFTIKYKFKNLPAGIIDIGAVGELSITASGQGYNLLQESIESQNIPINIDVDDNYFANKNIVNYGINNDFAYIVTNNLKQYINKKIGEKITITDIKPDTLFFDVVHITKKKVPIDFSTINFKLLKGEKVMIIKTSVDSVELTGQKNLIDSINSVRFEDTEIHHSRNRTQYELRLFVPEGVNISHKKVDVTAEIATYTEASKRVKIKALNFPENFSFIIEPREVTVYYSVSLLQYDKINDYDFAATLDYRKAVRNNVEIDVITQNHNVHILDVSPKYCTFLLHKK